VKVSLEIFFIRLRDGCAYYRRDLLDVTDNVSDPNSTVEDIITATFGIPRRKM
jgi:hypothetical protein